MAAKICSPRIQELHDKLTPLTTMYTLPSCSRVLTIIDDFAEQAASAPKPASPENEELGSICRRYQRIYRAFIRDLIKQSATKEHEMYDRAKAKNSTKRKRGGADDGEEEEKEDKKSRQKRRGRVFSVDKGEHIATALETLRLEEFLEEQKRENEKRVRFSE